MSYRNHPRSNNATRRTGKGSLFGKGHKYRTPMEEQVDKIFQEETARMKMQSELDKYGHKDASGGMVWTVGDLQRFFADSGKRKAKGNKGFDWKSLVSEDVFALQSIQTEIDSGVSVIHALKVYVNSATPSELPPKLLLFAKKMGWL